MPILPVAFAKRPAPPLRPKKPTSAPIFRAAKVLACTAQGELHSAGEQQ